MRPNLIPLGKKDELTKKEATQRLPRWQTYQTKYFEFPVSINSNKILICGKLPDADVQLVVFDFDGKVDLSVCIPILNSLALEKKDIIIYQITGNGGIHLGFLMDMEEPIFNIQKKTLKKELHEKYPALKSIDIRANGGLIFWNCKFKDTNEYKGYYTKFVMEKVIDSFGFHNKLDLLYEPDIKSNPIIYSKPRFDGPPNIRNPIKAIWNGSFVIQSGQSDEFQYWSVFWRECLSCGITQEKIIEHLRTGIQPEFDEQETLFQLKYQKYLNIRPSNSLLGRLFSSEYF